MSSRSLALSLQSSALSLSLAISFFLATIEIHLLSYIIYWFACVFAIILFVSMRACKMCVCVFICILDYTYICIYFSYDFASVFARCSSIIWCLLAGVRASERVRAHHLISVCIFAFMMNDIWAMRALQIRGLTNHFMGHNMAEKSLLFSRMKYLYYFMAIRFYFLVH